MNTVTKEVRVRYAAIQDPPPSPYKTVCLAEDGNLTLIPTYTLDLLRKDLAAVVSREEELKEDIYERDLIIERLTNELKDAKSSIKHAMDCISMSIGLKES